MVHNIINDSKESARAQHRKAPSIYLKQSFPSKGMLPGYGMSRQNSVERGVCNTSSKDNIHVSNPKISVVIQHNNYITNNTNNTSVDNIPLAPTKEPIGNVRPSSKIGLSSKAIIRNLIASKKSTGKETDRTNDKVDNGSFSNSSADRFRTSNYIIRNSSVEKEPETPLKSSKRSIASVDKLKPTQKYREMNPSLMILWREDILFKIDEELKFLSVLGQGSFAKVYEAIDLRNNQVVAVKVVNKSKITDPKRRQLIQTEINLMAKMRCKYIGELYRIHEDHKRIYIVMQICGTLTLNNFCRQFPGKKLNEEQAYAIFVQICKGVQHMHANGVAHRDLKLTNILIDEEYCVKIIDFGFSCECNELQKMYCGTPSYMSPEIVEKKNYDPRSSDIWSLGVVLFKLLTGEYAFGCKLL